MEREFKPAPMDAAGVPASAAAADAADAAGKILRAGAITGDEFAQIVRAAEGLAPASSGVNATVKASDETGYVIGEDGRCKYCGQMDGGTL